MHPHLAFGVCSALALGLSLPGQLAPTVADAIKKEGLENSKVMDYLDQLTNGIGARLTGSDNFTRACEWARSEFEKMGLQNVHLEKWGEFPVGWNRGQWSGRVTQPIELELQVATEAWTAGTKGRTSGRLVAAPKTAAEIIAAGAALKSCWLLVGAAPRGGFPAAMREACLQVGAHGFVCSGYDGDQAFPNRLRVFGSHQVRWDKLPQVPEIKVRNDQYKQVKALLDEGKDVLVEFDIRNQWRKGPIEVHNVIAEIPGREKPEEVVVVCGHLDSWHQATGTTDNGTGTTSTMEAARILAAVGAQPRRTIRFMLWGGEEQGLLGSRAYVQKHRQEMEKVSCVFNHDTGTNWANSLTVSNGMYEDMRKVFEPVMTMTPPDPQHEGPVFQLNKAETISGGGGSDHASFAAAGVPPMSWGLTGRSNYFQYTWHTQWDTYDVAIPEYQQHTATVIALAALGVADLPNLLDRSGVRASGGGLDARTILGSAWGLEFDELKIKSVVADGAGAKAGFKAGDVLVAIGDTKLEKLQDLRTAMREVESPWTITVLRSNERVPIKIERPRMGRRGESRPSSAPGENPRRGG